MPTYTFQDLYWSLIRAWLPLDPPVILPFVDSSTIQCPMQKEKEHKICFSSSPKTWFAGNKKNHQKYSGHHNTAMLPWKAEAEENFLHCFCASSELIFVFPIKSHFYINCLEQQGIGKLTQSLPRTKDDIGVTCLLLQKTLFIKGNGESRETIDSSLYPCTSSITATFWSLHFLHFSPPRSKFHSHTGHRL